MNYDMLSLGPARMDVFLKLPEGEVEEICSIDRKKCVITLGFGEKVAIKGVEFAIGGNTGNNAVGLTRLGHKVAMMGAMGDGWSDLQAMEILKKEGVETKYMEIKKGQNGFGAVLNYQEERTILSYYTESMEQFLPAADLSATWMYLTTAGENFEKFYEGTVAWAIQNKVKIAFNPGSRQIKVGMEKLKYAYQNTEILFVNREEAAKLLAMSVSDVRGLLSAMRNAGAKIVVITDGPGGTYAYDGNKFLHMPIVEAPVVERTGAGDGFGAGFLGAILSGRGLDEALVWGTVNSASVLGFIGPQAGLLSAAKMPTWLNRASGVRVEEL